jgi:hypothetical protein
MAKEYLDKLSAFIEKATSDCSANMNLECKHFFSGVALYADERICISLTPAGLAIKLAEETKDTLGGGSCNAQRRRQELDSTLCRGRRLPRPL